MIGYCSYGVWNCPICLGAELVLRSRGNDDACKFADLGVCATFTPADKAELSATPPGELWQAFREACYKQSDNWVYKGPIVRAFIAEVEKLSPVETLRGSATTVQPTPKRKPRAKKPKPYEYADLVEELLDGRLSAEFEKVEIMHTQEEVRFR